MDEYIPRYDPRWRQQATDPNELIVIERKKSERKATKSKPKAPLLKVDGGHKVTFRRDSICHSNIIHAADIFQAVKGKRPSESIVIRCAVALLVETLDDLLSKAKQGANDPEGMEKLNEELEFMATFARSSFRRTYKPLGQGADLQSVPTRREREEVLSELETRDMWERLNYVPDWETDPKNPNRRRRRERR